MDESFIKETIDIKLSAENPGPIPSSTAIKTKCAVIRRENSF